MAEETMIIQCPACESMSFQIHRSDSTVKFVCVHCGEEVPNRITEDR